ncbi:MAG TPA: acyl-ACP thioesterase domain-containing protein, partial [Acidimicrobiales bacterium]|nr:acyl-ACP thioesterase domain-containing protein [Acidimicrobiales bacterium]
MSDGAAEFVDPAPRARTVTRGRRVRLGDAGIDGRLRLDALARYLQDVASDDSRDAGFEGTGGVWVVRRTVLQVDVRPHLDDEVALTTFLG